MPVLRRDRACPEVKVSAFMWDMTDHTGVWALGLLPVKKNWREDWAEWETQGSTGTAGRVLRVIAMGSLTALQGLFPSGKHSAGEHACRGQALQGQNTLTLFSGRHKRLWKLMFAFFREENKRYIRTHIYLTLALWSFCFIQNTINFYLFIQECFINGFSDNVTLCNCGVMALWRSWRCFWLRNHVSQGKAVALVTTRTCVSSEQKGRCRPALWWRAREHSMNPTLSKRWLLPKGQKPGDCFGGHWRPLCHGTDTQRVHRQVGTFPSFYFSAFPFPELRIRNSFIVHMALF